MIANSRRIDAWVRHLLTAEGPRSRPEGRCLPERMRDVPPAIEQLQGIEARARIILDEAARGEGWMDAHDARGKLADQGRREECLERFGHASTPIGGSVTSLRLSCLDPRGASLIRISEP